MKLQANNLWFTSDTHYGHNNICRGVSNWLTNPDADIEMTRDFPDVETMDNAIVNGINNSVGADDWLVHLGDWSFGGFDKIQEFRERINCKNIVLMLGNHDHHIQNDKGRVRKLFSHVAHYEELRVTNDKKPTNQFVLCHYPIISWNGMHHGVNMLHGHQHLKGENRFGFGRRMDIGICGAPEFRPYHIEELLDALQINVNNTLPDIGSNVIELS
jgi:calcineurin-like phosphoesterase family protein